MLRRRSRYRGCDWPALAVQADRVRRPGGFTLLEVVLAMSVLVILAAIFWPNMASLRTGTRLFHTVDDVRGLLVGLRVRAMQEGVPYEFAYQPEMGVFRVQNPGDGSQSTLDAGDEEGIDSQRVSFDSHDLVGEHALEEGMTFAVHSDADANADALEEEDVTGDGWKKILFSPDGTATEASFAIYDDLGSGRGFHVRGLTGLVTVTKLEPRGDLGQAASGDARQLSSGGTR